MIRVYQKDYQNPYEKNEVCLFNKWDTLSNGICKTMPRESSTMLMPPSALGALIYRTYIDNPLKLMEVIVAQG